MFRQCFNIVLLICTKGTAFLRREQQGGKKGSNIPGGNFQRLKGRGLEERKQTRTHVNMHVAHYERAQVHARAHRCTHAINPNA